MKFLVVSLLRPGDLLMAAPIIAAIKKKHSGAIVHAFINKKSQGAAAVISEIDHVHVFDRDQIQSSLGEFERGIFEGYDRLKGTIEEINSNKYDVVINITHNELSGWICSLIKSKSHVGLARDEEGRAHFGSAWFEYLNIYGKNNETCDFHYVDIFQKALDIKTQTPEQSDIENIICLQPWSADSKKEWSLQNFKQVVRQLSESFNDYRFVLLAGPDEVEMANDAAAALSKMGVYTSVFAEDFSKTFQLLKKSKLLITVDTSIKHLGVLAGTSILEISVGSSSYMRTGAYSDRAVIVSTKADCAPCQHSSDCPYQVKKCVQNIDANAVTAIAQAFLNRDLPALRTLAREYYSDFDILKTQFESDGTWSAIPMYRPFSKGEISKWLSRSTEKMLRNSVNSNQFKPYGSEGVELERILNQLFPDQHKLNWIETYSTIDSVFSQFEADLISFDKELKASIRKLDDDSIMAKLEQRVSEIKNKYSKYEELSVALKYFINGAVGAEMIPFLKVRKIKEGTEKAMDTLNIEKRILQTIRSHALEIK